MLLGLYNVVDVYDWFLPKQRSYHDQHEQFKVL